MAGIGSPRQCRSGIDETDQPCHTGPAPVPRGARVGLDTGMNLAVRTGVGPVSSAVSCSRSSTASRFPRHPPAEPHIPGASALALRAPSDAPESEPHETSQSRRAEQQSRRTAVRRRHPMSDSDRHSHACSTLKIATHGCAISPSAPLSPEPPTRVLPISYFHCLLLSWYRWQKPQPPAWVGDGVNLTSALTNALRGDAVELAEFLNPAVESLISISKP